MAIRKFRKIMKPFTIVISLVFVLSLAYGGYESFRNSRANKKAQEAFKINGKIISKVDIERAKNELSNHYSSTGNIQIDKSLIDIVAFNQIIDKNLTLELSKKLKIKIPSSDVDKEYKKMEEAIGDKEQFKRMLDYQGFSKDSYRAKIEENLLLEKTIAAFSNEVVPTEEEIEKYYNSVINDRNIDIESVRENIIQDIKNSKGMKKYSETLNESRKNMKIEDLSSEYQNLLEKPLYTEDEFTITNLDLALQTISQIMQSGSNSTNKEEAEKKAKEAITKLIKISKAAREKGIKVSENLNTMNKLAEYQYELIEEYRKEIKPTDSDLKKYFEKNKSKYKVEASADVNFAFGNLKPSKEDEKKAKEKAEEVLKNVNVKNFEEYGKNLSRDEGYIFEDLGTFSKGMMVKEFEDAVRKTETNSINKDVVKTNFGYHIIYVKENNSKNDSWTAAHILVREIPSEKTIEEKMLKLEKIKSDISSGLLSFSELPKVDKDIVRSLLIKGVKPEGIIPNLGYNPEITEEVFKSKLNEVKIQNAGYGILIFQKIKEIKAENPSFEKSKTEIKNDYINNKAAEYMKKIIF